MPEPSPATAAYATSDSASALVRVLDEYLAALQTGSPPDKAELLARHPDLAEQLDSCLAALDFIHKAAAPGSGTEPPSRIGDFRIVREIGRGGMGVVYEAEQVSLGRPVALKVLRFGAADPGAMDRFRREAETVARLHHTNIVPVFAVGCESGVHFYAMQLIDGEGLDRAAARKPDFITVAKWGVQAAEALAHAHTRGVIHRDIKPSNLLLDREGTVWLTDFGLARRVDEVTITIAGMLMGTPRYMSPEQASAARHKVDARSDVYSLGATLYELATGRPVYDGDTPQRLLAQILGDEPVPPRRHIPAMPRDLETVLLKCLAREPNDRYGTAQELADDLRRFVNGDAIKARRPTPRERATRWAKKHRKQVTVLGLTALASVGLAVSAAGAFVSHQNRQRELAKRAYEDSLPQVRLTTDGPPLVVEILDVNGSLAAKVTVPEGRPVTLPPGEYTLRIAGPWLPVRIQPLLLASGDRIEIPLNVSSGVTFTTDGPPLVGEIQDEKSEAVVPPFPIPTAKPIVVPSGDYRVKLRGPWLPVEYESLHVTAGEAQQKELKLIGRLSLESNGPPLMAEVLNTSGERVVPAFTLPTPDPVSLPPGEHTLRLTGSGLWTENYDFTLRRGERVNRTLNLGDRAFGSPIKVTTSTGGEAHGDAWVVTRGGNGDVILLTNDGLKRVEWAIGRQMWAEVPTHPDLDAAPYGAQGEFGKWGQFFKPRSYHLGDNGPLPSQARLARPAPDLDGDGNPDLLFSSRFVPGLMAISGKTGKVLWYRTTAPPVSAEMQAAGWQARSTTGCVPMGEPVFVAIEGNNPDVITAVHAMESVWEQPGTKEKKRGNGGVWLEALAGKTGKVLWSSWLEESAQQTIGQRAFASHLTKLDGKLVLAVLAGRSVGVFDVATGKVMRGPFRLDFEPLGVPKVRTGEPPLFIVGRSAEGGDELVAIGALDGKVRWSHPLGFAWPKVPSKDGPGIHRHHVHAPPPDLPEIADLDGDGRAEVLVPIANPGRLLWEERAGGGVVALDGDTGKPRWMFRFDLSNDHESGSCRIKVIPDVTGDGKPDVAVVRLHWTWIRPENRGGNFTEVGIAVVSGADGKPVWQWNRRTPLKPNFYWEFPALGRLTTWCPGRDRKLQLVVPVFHSEAPTADLFLFDTGTGRFDREVKQFGEPTAADLDGDGMPDLYAYRPGPPGPLSQREFSLAAIRGTCPDVWRRLGAGTPGPDVDGDGTPDLFGNDSYSEDSASGLVAWSGATGRPLWRCKLDATAISAYPQRADLNGDGVPDVLVLCVRQPPEQRVDPEVWGGDRVRVAAVCGKTGRVLWQGADLTGTAGGKTLPLKDQFLFLRAVPLKSGEPPAVIGLSRVWGDGVMQYYAFALSGTDGRARWQTPVGPEIKTTSMAAETGAPAIADLDGDGVNDLVFWTSPRCLVAINGATGRVLWEREVEGATQDGGRFQRAVYSEYSDRMTYPAPAVAAFDGKGTFGVAFAHRPKDRDRVVLLNGKDGTERWAREGPPVRKATESNPPDPVTAPRFVRLREGTFLLGVAGATAPPRIEDGTPGLARRLVLLDATGKVHQERELPGPAQFYANLAPLPLWVSDFNGDGVDQVAFAADDTDRFVVLRDGLKEEAWALTFRAGTDSILSVRPSERGKPGTVVFRTETTVRGYDGKTGRALWACSGPRSGPWLPPVDPSVLPLVLFQASEHGTVARRAVPVAPDGKFLVPSAK